MIDGDIHWNSSDAAGNRVEALCNELAARVAEKERNLRRAFNVPGFVLQQSEGSVSVAGCGKNGSERGECARRH
jgi:hypothetical protein